MFHVICATQIVRAIQKGPTPLQRFAESKNSAIGKHFLEAHGSDHQMNDNHKYFEKVSEQIRLLIIIEMLYIKKLKPTLKTQNHFLNSISKFVISTLFAMIMML